jgi:hypothetical protein
VFALDVVGSEKYMEKHGNASYSQNWALLKRGIAESISSEGGEVLPSEGDAMKASLPTATAAVRTALTVQVLMAEAPGYPDALRVRIGIDWGEVQFNTDGSPDFNGLTVVKAFRLRDAAKSHQVFVSTAVHDTVGREIGKTFLGKPVRWEDWGKRQFKHDSRDVWEVGIEGVGAFEEPCAPKAPPGAPSNLPALSPNLIPRPHLAERIHEALLPDELGVLRVAAVRALGGAGKSVAALQYGHRFQGFYKGGNFWLPLESGDLKEGLVSLARYLDVPVDSQSEITARRVVERLASIQPSLLVLDNVADEMSWAGIVATGLLPPMPCRVLMTTRSSHIPKASMISVDRLSREEARGIYHKFCAGEAGKPRREFPDDKTADAITDWLEGLAVAVAAVGARMKLQPRVAWKAYWKRLQELDLADLPDANDAVRAEMGADAQGLQERRRTLHVINDAIDSLLPLHQRMVEYAALIQADRIPRPALLSLTQADIAPPIGGVSGPCAIAVATPADQVADPAEDACENLLALGILRRSSDDGGYVSLHRLWRQQLHRRLSACGDKMAHRLTSIAAAGLYVSDIGIGTSRGAEPVEVVLSGKISLETMGTTRVGIDGEATLVLQDGARVHFPGAGYASVVIGKAGRLIVKGAETSVESLAVTVDGEMLVIDGARAQLQSPIGVRGFVRVKGNGSRLESHLDLNFGKAEVSDGGSITAGVIGGSVWVGRKGRLTINHSHSLGEIVVESGSFSSKGYHGGGVIVARRGAQVAIAGGFHDQTKAEATDFGTVVTCGGVALGASLRVTSGAVLEGDTLSLIGNSAEEPDTFLEIGQGGSANVGKVRITGGAQLTLSGAALFHAKSIQFGGDSGGYGSGSGTLCFRFSAAGRCCIECDGNAHLDGRLVLDFEQGTPPLDAETLLMRAASITGSWGIVEAFGLPSSLFHELVTIGSTMTLVIRQRRAA